MAIKIKLKNSVTQNAVPTGTHLPEVGELAVNANINSIGGYMRASDNSIVKIFGPGSVSTPAASTTAAGIAELATSAETTTGTDTARVTTPAGVKAVTDAERTTSNSTYLAKAGGTLTGVLVATAGSNSAPAIHFGDSDSGIYGGTNTVSLTAAGTQGLTLNSSGYVNVPTRLGVGVASPDVSFEVNGGADSIAKITGTTTAARLDLKTNSHHRFIQVLESDGGLRFYDQTSAGEMLRIDSSGRLLVGTSTSAGANRQFQIAGTSGNAAAMSICININNNNGPLFDFVKSRNASYGSSTIVQDDDLIGKIQFRADDGTDYASQVASIASFVDGTVAGNRTPGRLVFGTTADSAGSVAPTTALTLDSSQNALFAGKVLIGTNTAGHSDADDLTIVGGTDTGITLRSAWNGDCNIYFADGTTGGGQYRAALSYDHSADEFYLKTNAGSTALTVDNSQNATFAGSVYLTSDTKKLFAGAENEMQVFHDGTNSIVKDTRDTGSVKIQADNFSVIDKDAAQTLLSTVEGGSTKLYWGGNGTATIQTTSTGVDINSNGTSHGLNIKKGSTVAVHIGHIGTGDEGYLSLKNGGVNTIEFNGETGAATFAGKVVIDGDGGQKYFAVGDNEDFKIYHDATGPTILSDANNQGLKVQAKNLTFTEHTGVTTRFIINDYGHVGIGVTPSAWPTNADSKALQIGTGFVAYGRGSGDQDRGGIAVNYYNDGSNEKYIANGHANRIYMNDGNIEFQTAGENASGAGAALTWTTGMRMMAGGNVGIGTTSPGSLLSISGADDTVTGISLGQGVSTLTASRYIGICQNGNENNLAVNSGFQGIEFGGPGSADEGYLAFHSHDVGVSSGERIRISKSGNVGIGTTSPSELLSLRHATSNTVLDLECLAANDGTTGNIIKFRGKGANGVSYHASQIKGITENAANNAGFLSFWTNSAGTVGEKLRITSDGNVGIGTTGPGEKLDVRDGDIILSSTNAGSAHRTSFIEFTGSYAKIISEAGFGSDGASNYASGWKFTTRNYTGSAFENRTPLSIHANGDVKISDGNLIIGGAGHGISFINAADIATGESVSSSVLDEYEEGTFDVNYKTGAGGGNTLSSATYTTTGGFYTKVGRIVHIQVRLKCTASNTSPGGQIVIEGLPFEAHSSNVVGGVYITASEMLGVNDARILVDGYQLEFLTHAGGALNSGAGGLNFNGEFMCAGTYIAT